eukprot:TRINITY_DN27619_c0_g1_i1.p1 TRINITY_DN27619_c0_g1~~TRINITY_DN27619_c0_g1_i1.p1  ORF type:complete len:819 (-),score=148.00 TRINITY_DN27619_c0_g1_i1:117-2573(-)
MAANKRRTASLALLGSNETNLARNNTSNWAPLPSSADAGDDEPGQFKWNGRECEGSCFHVAALNGDVAAVHRLLTESSNVNDLVKSRFTYSTTFQGKTQEGSGEAIHLVASRGHVEVAKLLIAAEADLSSSVSRDHKPHYDVLHAAMFAEGRGGSFEMIKYLFEAKAEMTKNQDGRYPLHIAFMTGNVPVIQLLRTFLQKEGIEDAHLKDPRVPLPLEMGISQGKMSEEQLSYAAELSTLSLTTFIQECPSCISSFVKRLHEETQIEAMEFARNLTRFDIAKVLRESPEAACALLDHATGEPKCENRGWHPLPTRVSFAPRDHFEWIRNFCNPPKTYITYYEAEHVWGFDSQAFKSMPWHAQLMDRSIGRPIVDADVRVCHVPDLVCAEVFSALCDSNNDSALFLFEHDVISATIKHVFWEGCSTVDLTTAMLSVWGLGLLLFEEVHIRGIRDADGEEHKPVQMWMSPTGDDCRNDAWVSINWVAAKGVLDLISEIWQFRGLVAIGRPKDYLGLDNLIDMLFSCLPLVLFFYPRSIEVMVLSVFLYWSRVLECFTSAEFIGTELLPIRNLARGLIPALSVTFVAFGAFTHAFYLVQGRGFVNLWPDVFFHSFATLITAGLPDKPDELGTFELLILFFAVLSFSVFILNIFIGVMGELYVNEKAECVTKFRQLRAGCCVNFLLRCQAIPCNILSEKSATAVMIVAMLIAFGVQIYCFLEHSYEIWVGPTFIACQLTIILSSYQAPSSPWASKDNSKDHYIWYIKRKEAEKEDALHEDVQHLRDTLDGMQKEWVDQTAVLAEVKRLLEMQTTLGVQQLVK